MGVLYVKEKYTVKELRERRVLWLKYFAMTNAELDEDADVNLASVGDWVTLVHIAMDENKNSADAWRILNRFRPRVAHFAAVGDLTGLAREFLTTRARLCKVLFEM